MRIYSLRRYSASGIFYGERILTGSRREILDWLSPVLEQRAKAGWEVSRMRNSFELTHDERADVHTFSIIEETEDE